jgi:choline kinase
VRTPATIVINAAGKARRIRAGLNKSLIKFHGRSLISWQLASIPADVPVVIGIGYQATEVLKAARRERPDITHFENPSFETTGTAATLALSFPMISGRILSLDGDLLVHPKDLTDFIYANRDVIGVTSLNSREPIAIETAFRNGAFVGTNFRTDLSQVNQGMIPRPNQQLYEWTGLVNFDPSSIAFGDLTKNVHHMLEPALPLRAHYIRCCEIDYSSEIDKMRNWISENLKSDND